MRAYNRYVLSLAVVLLLTTLALVAAGVQKLADYYTLYVLEALVITELFVYFNRRARRGLTLVSIVLFAGFLAIVAARVAALLLA